MKTTKSKSISSKGSRSKAPSKSKATSNTTVTKVAMPVSYGYSVSRSGSRSVRFTNREYVADLTASATAGKLVVLSWVLNPGRALLFPWLSTFANSFDSYCVHRVRAEYIPRCATSQGGQVQMSFDYHCLDSPPKSSQEMAMNWQCVTGPLYAANTLSLDISKLHYKRYFTAIDGSSPKETSDMGLLNVTIESPNANTFGGTLWIDYDIELFEPQMDETLNRTGGEVGFPRLHTLADLVGPQVDGFAYPISADGLWYVAIPKVDSNQYKFWQGPEWITYARNGTEIVLPTEWRYAKIDLVMRGTCQTQADITLATFAQFVKVESDTGTGLMTLLTNTAASNCPWVTGATANLLTAMYCVKRGDTGPIIFRPSILKTFGDKISSLAMCYFVSKISESEYDDLILPADMP